MKRIDPPTHRVRPTLALCVSRIEDDQFKVRAESIADELETGESAYEDAARRGTLHTVPETENVGALSGGEMEGLYIQRLSKKGHPAREIYDSIRAAAKFNVCPLCGHRQVATLDHHLPKSSHRLFAITPMNLIPCCSDCNKAKLAHVADDAASQTFHPYFDNFDDAVWLCAQIIEGAPPAARFVVNTPAGWSDVKQRRAAAHFSKLGLSELYGSNAAQELAQISGNLREIADTAGAQGVKDHLAAQARSRATLGRNSWQAALYEALAQSDWFCDGGHRAIQT